MAAGTAVLTQLPLLAADDSKRFRPQMTIDEAAKPFLKERYAKEGDVDLSGRVRNGGLGCSAFVSVMLHRMRDGPDWLKSYDLAPSARQSCRQSWRFLRTPDTKTSWLRLLDMLGKLLIIQRQLGMKTVTVTTHRGKC